MLRPLALAVQGLANFQAAFTEGFASNEISAIPIEAGQTKDIKLEVTTPRDLRADDYPVLVRVAIEGANAETRIILQVSGQGRFALSATTLPRSASPLAASRLQSTSGTPSLPRPYGGIVGIGIIAVALLVLLGAVARFGRR